MSIRVKFWLILVLAAVSAVLAYPREDKLLSVIGLKHTHLAVNKGLDLVGGARLVYRADFSKIDKSNQATALDGVVKVIQKRINAAGTGEANVRVFGSDRIIVELPNINDPAAAKNLIGKAAQLSFLNEEPDGQITTIDLSGNDVGKASVSFDQTGKPVVDLQLKGGAATDKWSSVTTKDSQDGGKIAILLDGVPVFGPAGVPQPLLDGRAQLQGNFAVEEAKQVAQQINSGALPVPLGDPIQQSFIGPTLGAESIARSLVAGLIGLGIVAIFMIVYYRLAGLLAVGALSIYTVLTLAIYKLSTLMPPYAIVLTLAGIAGFILSIGMAVDANILILERMKEELRHGKSFVAAVEAGFDRAWTSIRDSNVSTLITCVILFNFSGGSPIIKGFAVTLGLGVIISLFTAVVVSRTFLRLLIRTRLGSKPTLYGLKEESI